MNNDGNLMETLEKSAMYQDYERAFCEVTGMPIALRPLETWRLPLHGKRNEAPFCSLMAGKNRTCAACLQLQQDLARDAKDGPRTMTCAYGLCETAVPVKLGEKTIGFLQTGQVLRHPPTEALFGQAVGKMKELGQEPDTAEARKAFFQTPVVSRRRLDSVESLLGIFADQLAAKGNQLAIQAANAEPPMIAKAKHFIREHHSEELSLGRVAAAVSTSLFHFCKLFKKATGLNFTEYVSRVRVEKSKDLLLNPNLRVSEIAFAAGFQSLTHFNRVFKNMVGESPTRYRDRLHGPAASAAKGKAPMPARPGGGLA